MNKKRSKYVALALALRAEGWDVVLSQTAGPCSDWYTAPPDASPDAPRYEEEGQRK